ncbi:hypothetical protein ACUN7V_17115 [Quadrisphaera oryzae]|uniref:hypothetical protein n=1 Tax=Quadrisphaera TaxID=317661 RepID=UPI0016441B52|nr:hypothetical protein [Quadrisphaera sp. RL12-1S]MBC3761824.1 hypothetical protein [Quadrisphaera sp. RL12-1S]
MPESPHPLTNPAPPTGVMQLVEEAAHRGLLKDGDSLASGIERAGWRRDTHGGWWTYEPDPAWRLGSTIDPADVSIFATGSDAVVAAAADQVASHLTAGGVEGLVGGGADELGVRSWRGSAVSVDLYFSPTKTVDFPGKKIEIPCCLQLAVARQDAPSDRQPSDHERARRAAQSGTRMQRWYLAAQDDLPADVVQALALDDEPAVVAALKASAGQRERWRKRVADGVEDA